MNQSEGSATPKGTQGDLSVSKIDVGQSSTSNITTKPTGRSNLTGKKNARPTWSCSECTRRKIRCDKVFPCSACTKRGTADKCHLDEEDPHSTVRRDPLSTHQLNNESGSPKSEEQVIRESVVSLRQRLHHVETLIARFTPETRGDQTFYRMSPEVSTSGRQPGSPSVKRRKLAGQDDGFKNQDVPSDRSSDEEVEAAVRLEFVALGRDRKEDHHHRSGVRKLPQSEQFASTVNLTAWTADTPAGEHQQAGGLGNGHTLSGLRTPTHSSSALDVEMYPEKETCNAIIRYSLERVAWHYGCVHKATFENECQEFWDLGHDRGKLVNQAWLAFFYSILCAGAQHMSADFAAEIGITPSHLLDLPTTYFKACVESLHRADFLAKHSIYSVQACTVLVVSCQSAGPSDLAATLLSTAIRIAQHLNLHRLGKDADWLMKQEKNGIALKSDRGIKAFIDREVRKRTWCALTTEDWVSVPYRRSYAIFPDHVTTALPLNCHDADLSSGTYISRDHSEATIVSKIVLSLQLASCVRRLFDKISRMGTHSYESCLAIDKEVRMLVARTPGYLDLTSDISSLPPYIDWQRYNWSLQVAHTFLVIHRPFLGRSLRDKRYEFSRYAAMSAARAILRQISQSNYREAPLWTTAYHGVAAATILVLDVFQSTAKGLEVERDTKRQEVQHAIKELEAYAIRSAVAARGVKLLDALLAEEERQHPTMNRSPLQSKSVQGHREVNEGDTQYSNESFDAVARRAATQVVSSSSNLSPSSSNNHVSPGITPQSPAPLPPVFFSPRSAQQTEGRLRHSPSPPSQHLSHVNSYPADYFNDSPGGIFNDEGGLSQTFVDSLLFSGMGASISMEDSTFDSSAGTDLWGAISWQYEAAGHSSLDAEFH